MDNSKTPSYYINKIICDIKFSILHVNGLSLHDYGNIQLEIIYDTILCDFPVLLNMLEEIMKE